MDNKPLTGAELDSLYALIERGPLPLSEIPSKSGCTSLIERGFVVQIVKNMDTSNYAATMNGCRMYNYLQGQTNLMAAYAARQTKTAIMKAQET